jgi:hypothetical protein
VTELTHDQQADRDAQLRRAMLNVARLNAEVYQHGYVPWSSMANVKDREGRKPGDDAHVASLLEHLLDRGYLAEAQQMGLDRSPQSNRHRRFKFTDLGFALWTQRIPVDPMVDDSRLETR